MKYKRLLLIGLVFLSLFALTSIALAGTHELEHGNTLVKAVRQAAAQYKNVEAAEAAGYGLFHGCVSGPQEGAMGIHYVNGDLVGDGEVDALQPEALIYEIRDGRLQLVGVEYVVIAES